jgi:hypothetical protein
MNAQSLYHAALLHLLQQTQAFCQAYNHARIMSEQYDPKGALHDGLGAQVAEKVIQELRHQVALTPGLREAFVLALQS